MTREEYMVSNLESLPECILKNEKRCYLNIEKKYGHWIIKYTNLTKDLFCQNTDLFKAIEEMVERLAESKEKTYVS